MLNKKEKAVFKIILENLHKKNSCLITIEHILEKIDPKYNLKDNDIIKIITELSFDGYIESVVSNNKDRTFYCINLLKKGEGFWREEQQRQRTVISKILLTVSAGILSFVLTLILKAIFS